MPERLLVAPAREPLLIAEVQEHLRLQDTTDDTLLKALIPAARVWAENRSNRQFVEAKWELKLDGFPDATKYQGGKQPDACGGLIRPPHSPLLSVSSIAYVDTAGTSQTWSSSEYAVDAHSEPARISPAYNEVWPTTRAQMNAVTVTYLAGYLCSFTASDTTDVLTTSGRNYATGEKVRLAVSEGGALPGGLSLDTDYYVVGASSNTLQLAATSGGSAIDLTSSGSGTLYLGEVPALAREAMLLCVAFWFARRGDDADPAALTARVPALANELLDLACWDGSLR
jgi:uncharacterized phiE125 gp8 family phage protein